MWRNLKPTWKPTSPIDSSEDELRWATATRSLKYHYGYYFLLCALEGEFFVSIIQGIAILRRSEILPAVSQSDSLQIDDWLMKHAVPTIPPLSLARSTSIDRFVRSPHIFYLTQIKAWTTLLSFTNSVVGWMCSPRPWESTRISTIIHNSDWLTQVID